MKIPMTALLFIAGAALSWGVYVPIVHEATQKLGSNLRAFLMVGVAYFLVAVLVPAWFIFIAKNDPTAKAAPNFNMVPVVWGIAAGTAGALGALCVIFAANTAGRGGLIYVAPLVFAGAPIINTIATITIFHPVKTLPDWRFFMGLVLAACGAAMVMVFKPVDAPHAPAGGSPPAATAPSESGGHK